jgi:hypothetical protein
MSKLDLWPSASPAMDTSTHPSSSDDSSASEDRKNGSENVMKDYMPYERK